MFSRPSIYSSSLFPTTTCSRSFAFITGRTLSVSQNTAASRAFGSITSYGYFSQNTHKNILSRSTLSTINKRPSPYPSTRLRFAQNNNNEEKIMIAEFSSEASNYNSNQNHQHYQQIFLNDLKTSFTDHILPNLPSSSNHNNGNTNENVIILLLAVSGGCDSIALLHGTLQILDDLRNTQNQKKIEVHVAHFDHCQRGKENSDLDREFVKNISLKYDNVPFHSFCWDSDKAKGGNNDRKFSQEMARDWRRFHLIQLLHDLTTTKYDNIGQDTNNQNFCPTSCCGVILTAHHADDSDETLLLKLLRGTHITNLSGLEYLTTMESPIQSHQSTATLFAKPMLNLRKHDIINFLNEQNLTWREDLSNKSNKYLRNRVRNELIPLMTDILSSSISDDEYDENNTNNTSTNKASSVLAKRLSNLSIQSKSLKKDLNERAQLYLQDHVDRETHQFILPPITKTSDNITNTIQLTLDQQEALHQWVNQRMNMMVTGENSSVKSHNLTFDRLQSICKQLYNHPTKTRWILNIGNNWNIVRCGNILDVQNSSYSTIQTSNSGNVKHTENLNEDIPWILERVETTNIDFKKEENSLNTGSSSTFIYFKTQSESTLPQQLTFSRVQGNEHKLFMPSWRKRKDENNNERKSIKIKEFLRGQKVPLHKRQNAIILHHENNDEIVAVLVQREEAIINDDDDQKSNTRKKEEWFVGVDYFEPYCRHKKGENHNDFIFSIRSKDIL